MIARTRTRSATSLPNRPYPRSHLFTYVRLAAEPDPPFVDPAPQTLVATAIEDDRFPVARCGGVLKQGASVPVPGLHISHECAQQWLALAGSVVHPFLDAPLADPEAADFRVAGGTGHDPDRPLLGLGGSPGSQVGVEGSDGTQDRLELAASLPVGPGRDLLSSPPVELAVGAQVRLIGRGLFDRGPEMAGQMPGLELLAIVGHRHRAPGPPLGPCD
ncbi:hypothetical protein [Streptosporangium sp. NPDC003464]